MPIVFLSARIPSAAELNVFCSAAPLRPLPAGPIARWKLSERRHKLPMGTFIAESAESESYEESHLIRTFYGNADGPTLVAVGNVHCNEPSGRLALERVASRLGSLEENLHSRAYLLA